MHSTQEGGWTQRASPFVPDQVVSASVTVDDGYFISWMLSLLALWLQPGQTSFIRDDRS